MAFEVQDMISVLRPCDFEGSYQAARASAKADEKQTNVAHAQTHHQAACEERPSRSLVVRKQIPSNIQYILVRPLGCTQKGS